MGLKLEQVAGGNTNRVTWMVSIASVVIASTGSTEPRSSFESIYIIHLIECYGQWAIYNGIYDTRE